MFVLARNRAIRKMSGLVAGTGQELTDTSALAGNDVGSILHLSLCA